MIEEAPKTGDLRVFEVPFRRIGFGIAPGGVRVERFSAAWNKWMYLETMTDLESFLECPHYQSQEPLENEGYCF
jgi:hypothetical protein